MNARTTGAFTYSALRPSSRSCRNGTPQAVGLELQPGAHRRALEQARAEALGRRRLYRRTVMLLPLELKPAAGLLPFDRHPAAPVAQRAIFDRIGAELVQRQGQRDDLLV